MSQTQNLSKDGSPRDVEMRESENDLVQMDVCEQKGEPGSQKESDCPIENLTREESMGSDSPNIAGSDLFNNQKEPESQTTSEPHWQVTEKKRFVGLLWPREIKGPVMRVTPRGKEAANGVPLWGASLTDFYFVRRIPDCHYSLTISTASKLCAWVEQIKELDAAKEEIIWAKRESLPRQLYPYPISALIEEVEIAIRSGQTGRHWEVPGKLPEIPTSETSIFHPSKYQAPWPLKPFSANTFRLQQTIPLNLLPQKLVVHDPWDCLRVHDSDAEPTEKLKWGTKPDIIHKYEIRFSETAKEERAQSESYPDVIGKIHPSRKNYCFIFHRDEYDTQEWRAKFGDHDHLYVPLPPKPPTPESTPEAHLYLTPSRRIGKGHHSVVFQAELQLPRRLLVDDKICRDCAAPTLRRASLSIGPTLGFIPMTPQDTKGFCTEAGLGAVDVQWQNPEHAPYCKHFDTGPVPATATVSVAAKLSIPRDSHLYTESHNYQSFAAHMFQHWSGFNAIPPINDPVPVGAVAPQLYGYYAPEVEDESGAYLSDILLLENCGTPVDPTKLCWDDKQECFSLLCRLHREGLGHGSAFQRNIVMQNGPLHEHPSRRSAEHPSFRLIDYGRSAVWSALDRSAEEGTASKELGLTY